MQPVLSIIICAHNPCFAYLQRVLDALKQQTLQRSTWELLLIDNACDHPLEDHFDLSWHRNARHIRENQLGLTSARLRGVSESQADVLIFVDDDNILDADYLEAVNEISRKYPFIGAWGGQIRPEFEIEPPLWTKPYWGILAIREFDQEQWSNFSHHSSTPCGAGLCVRRIVAKEYSCQVLQAHERRSLDRKGNLLTSCGDTDLALTAHDIGLGTGQFTSLKLTHLIPEFRLQEEYLLRLIESMNYSGTHLFYLREGEVHQPHRTWEQKLLDYYRFIKMSPREKRFQTAAKRGRQKALNEIFH